MLSPGDVVERYEVERELGGGGMARVYKVHHVALGSVHALKVLEPELVGNAELRARFLDEGRIQARLKHPNILGITDVVAAPGVAGLVMDYLEGESLDKYLARLQAPLSAQEVRDIFLPVLEGMGFAHEQGVIHRDLKPSNIFLEQVYGRRVVRLLDFGIAKVASAEGRPETRTGVRMGTPQYMSPEQIRGARDVTVRSDVFSLGVTLYELATGQPCYQGESDFNIMEKIVRADFVPPEGVHPGLEPGLLAAIRRAMEVEPERRFASCREFAAALRETGGMSAPVPVSVPTPAPTPAPVPVEVPVSSPGAPAWGLVSPRIPTAKASAPAAREAVPDTDPQISSAPVVAPRPAPVPEPVAAPRPVAEPIAAPRPAPVPEPVAAPRPVPPPAAELPRPTPISVPGVTSRPTPAPVPRPAVVRPVPAERVPSAEPTPARVLEQRGPAPVKERALPVPRSAPLKREPEPVLVSGGRPWRWILLFVFAGILALLGSGLLGLLTGKH